MPNIPSFAGYICPQTSASKNSILGLEEVWWRWIKQTQGIDKTGEDGKRDVAGERGKDRSCNWLQINVKKPKILTATRIFNISSVITAMKYARYKIKLICLI